MYYTLTPEAVNPDPDVLDLACVQAYLASMMDIIFLLLAVCLAGYVAGAWHERKAARRATKARHPSAYLPSEQRVRYGSHHRV